MHGKQCRHWSDATSTLCKGLSVPIPRVITLNISSCFFLKACFGYSLVVTLRTCWVYSWEVPHIFSASQRHFLWVSTTYVRRGTSDEYPKHMFSWKKTKNINIFAKHFWSYSINRMFFFLHWNIWFCGIYWNHHIPAIQIITHKICLLGKIRI